MISMIIGTAPIGDVLLLSLDLLGTLAFAISGAMAAIRRRADIFGVLVLAVAAANSGGILRDMLLGAVPPAVFQDLRYMVVSALAGMVAFFWHDRIHRVTYAILILDAAGLALFAVAGTQKALDYQLHPAMAVLMGVLTAVGGGVVRDLLLNEIPWVLRREVYAVAALLGATMVVVAPLMGLSPTLGALAGTLVCFGLRLAAVMGDWHLPVARFRKSGDVAED